PLLVAVGVGVIAAMGSERFRRPATALGIACLIALVLAMGTSFPPTASLSRLLFEHVAAYSLFREPQKWVSLVALGYAVFAAAGIDAARTVGPRLRIPLHDVVFLGLALPLIATHVMLWGLGGQVKTSAFPRAWAQAEAAIRGKPGKLLFLPWHLYEPLPFAGNRVLANPAPDYFSLPTLISTRAELSTRRSVAATDPATQYVDELLRHRSDLRYFGHLIAPLGVHYVALASVADAPTYHFLASQRDLRSLFTTGSLTLYDNTAFRGSLYNIHQRVASRSIRQLLASPTLQRKTSYFLNATSGSVEGIKGPSETRALPLWQRVSSSRRGYLGTDLSCADGWRLGSSVPVCNLGAVAAFRKNTRQAVLWRPGFGTQILGYAVSSVALIALVLGCWGTRNQLPGTSRAGA
ncbi:MAG: hypothetical protein M3P18_18280, partial [Actinomycetota bacterium]|nr:hypothetical protein [Actinomycetota bacterium]